MEMLEGVEEEVVDGVDKEAAQTQKPADPDL